MKMRGIASDVVAAEILDPQAGKVIFTIRDEDKGVVRLSAQKKILAENSEYFKTRKQIRIIANFDRICCRVGSIQP